VNDEESDEKYSSNDESDDAAVPVVQDKPDPIRQESMKGSHYKLDKEQKSQASVKDSAMTE
jgi:hypothetical protein